MLDNIRVASPCSADWSKMEGNDRVRFCNACQLNVYNFSEMTEREVRQLIQSHEGRRLCGRLYRRKDGTILTRNCPVGLRTIVRRLSRVAGAILSFMTPGFAAAQTQTNIQSSDSRASLEVHATDLFGVAITNAQVILTQSSSNKTIQGRTDSEGKLRLYADANGDYTMKVTAPGFQSKEDHVKLRKGDAVSLQVVLQISASMGEIVTVQPSASLPDHPPTAGQAQNKLENGENSAGIEVLVADQSGAVVANAEVILKQSGNGKKIQAKTDANGRAFFPGFSSGDYGIEVASAGFKILSTHVQFKSGDALSLRLVLRASEEAMGIIVTTDAPLIDTSPTVSHTFTNQDFKAGSVR